MEVRHDIVPAQLAVKAMRDNGYKNAAYALAELVDNSIQAGASVVQILLGERMSYRAKRRSTRIEEICVLDNGDGMSEEVLRAALQFGNGTHLDLSSQKGIGKFGMGLPSSSISQCERLDVYTWQKGLDSVMTTYLDLKKIEKGEQSDIPQPHEGVVPEYLRQIKGVHFSSKGTLVRWRKLDRLMWKTANAIINNSDFLIGRIYRYFLVDRTVKIQFIVYDIDDPSEQVGLIRDAQANDPMYLMKETEHGDLFEPYVRGIPEGKTFEVKFKGEIHKIKVLFSIVKSENRDKDQTGATDYGQHAGKNIGVSIVRAKRELELEQSWTYGYDTRHRWWGAEVQFDPGLDEVFGVSNNKQYARYLTKTYIDESDSRLETQSSLGVRLDMKEVDDPAYVHLQISKFLDDNIRGMMNAIKRQGAGSRKTKGEGRHTPSDIQKGTNVIRTRQAQGKQGQSDEGESDPPTQRMSSIQDLLQNDAGFSPEDANSIAAQIVDENVKIMILQKELASSIFFDIQSRAGELIIWLNTKHPAYEQLVDALESDSDTDQDPDELTERLERARSGLRLLLMAWARYEDELGPTEREQAEDVRVDWGRMARHFLKSR